VWTLVTEAPGRVLDWSRATAACSTAHGGRIHQKPFAARARPHDPQGRLTGIEIMNRLTSSAGASEHRRAGGVPRVELLRDEAGVRPARCCSTCARHVRGGAREGHAAAMGGGPTMYGDRVLGRQVGRRHRAGVPRGLPLRDMEMVQFHPTAW